MTFPCAGIIVFNGDKTILVSTERGNHSFPKGKREKSESDLEAAWRELGEETGLTSDEVQLINGVHFDELSNKGFPSVRYFVGHLTRAPVNGFTFDHTELAEVKWYPITEVLQMDRLKGQRKEILEKAYTAYRAFRTL